MNKNKKQLAQSINLEVKDVLCEGQKYPYEHINFFQNVLQTRKLKKHEGIFIENYINSNNYRSDEFTKSHVGKHILFIGCSFTFGTGLEVEEIWAKKVYNKISLNEKTSGFFNLGVLGASMSLNVANLFKYFKIYGNPDLIFFNVTELNRFYNYDTKTKNIIDARYFESSSPVLDLLGYQQYEIVEQYCFSHNIDLYSFSWSKETDKILNTFETYYSMTEAKIYEDTIKEISKNENIKKTPWAVFARDHSHYGTIFHDKWSDFIYSKYLKNEINK
jgi:hypothetical protein